MQNFTENYKSVILPKLQKELELSNIMSSPRIEKIVVNVGIGSRLKVTKDYSDIIDNISAITGQKPVTTMSKKAISNFKLRIGMPTGIVTTLRKERMMSFLNRMINVAFPRIRDFQGFTPKAFDGQGNYSIGIKDCSIFTEVNPDDLSHVHGMSITIITSADNDEHARALLKALNFPFRKPIVVAKKEEEATEEPAEKANEENTEETSE